MLQLQNHDKDFTSKGQPTRLQLKNLVKIQNVTIIITISQDHIFKSQQHHALIQPLSDKRDSDQTWER